MSGWHLTVVAGLFALTAGCATPISETSSRFIEAEGFVTTGSETDWPSFDASAQGQPGWHSGYGGDLRIVRLLSGQVRSRTIPIRYIAHSQINSEYKIRFRLMRVGEDPDLYVVCAEVDGIGFDCN